MAGLSDDLYSANPSAVSCETANQIMKDGLRSVIMSKLAFDTFKEFGTSAAASEHDSPNLLLEPVVALLEEELTNGEVPFTTAFCKDSEIKASASSVGLTAHGEWTFSQTKLDGRKTRPRSDVVFVRDETDPPFDEDTMEQTPVALLEVGVAKGKGSTASDDKWFEKFGQGTRYIDLMNNDAVAGQKRKLEESKDSQESFVNSQGTESEQQQDPEPTQLFGKLKMSDPILFYVIAFGNEPDEEEEVQCMKIGCFISQKRAGDRRRNTTRLALLYRKHVQGKDAIGNALCTMLKQIYWFSAQVKDRNKGNNWKYLGPHCALVPAEENEGSEDRKEVYRAYDSRPWPITRSSSVYDSKMFVTSREIEVTEVDKKADVPVAGYRIFNVLGGLKVIAVPFIEGSHQPQNKAQLLGVAKFLKRMHDQGFVHGDVRLLNIVFTDEASDCQLIDFDFGGRSDDPLLMYPPGYKKALGDGKRIGSAGHRILKWHDVYALYYAFDQVLVGKSIEWDMLKISGMIELSIDKLIEVADAMVSRGDCIIAIPPELLMTLEKNTKLGKRSQSQKTREGDAVSPAKQANND